jgi:hypothetical protein
MNTIFRHHRFAALGLVLMLAACPGEVATTTEPRKPTEPNPCASDSGIACDSTAWSGPSGATIGDDTTPTPTPTTGDTGDTCEHTETT